MAKFNIGINGADQGAAEGREAWSGELPPTGSYSGVVKILSLAKVGSEAKNAGADKIMVGIELRAEKGSDASKYDGYIAWGQLVLIESAAPYINQFLLALTDGSDEEFEKIKQAFYNNGPTVDERKKHILKIGNYVIDSPNGELPIKISLTKRPFTNSKTGVTVDQVSINSYLLGGGSSPTGSSGGPEVAVAEDEDSTVDIEPEDQEVDVDIDSEADSEDDVSVADDEALLD